MRSGRPTVREKTNIMVETLSWEEKLQLQEWIGKGSKTFELLFSIRKDGCDSVTFHKLCDSKGPTVTVLYNTNDSVFGGYTSVEWKSLNCYKEDNNAFLFQLRYNGDHKTNKFPHRDGKKAIYDGKSYGPYFGSGPDLFTFKDTVKTDKDYFILNGKMKSSTFDMSLCATEKINNDHMHVKELEVYQVQDTPVKKWRKTPDCHWNEQTMKDLKEEVRNFAYQTKAKITEANILLLGPIGAGKSSFVNTIYSTFKGYYTTVANSGSAEKSLTTRAMSTMLSVQSESLKQTPSLGSKFRRYSIPINDKPLPFTLCDTTGLEDLDLRDLGYILDGKVPDGYQCFHRLYSNHTIHLHVDNCKYSVPQMLLLTKVDKVCPLVQKDLSMIFDSAHISSLVEETAHVFGLPRGHILPVKNYENEQDAEVEVDILALLTLRQILRSSDGFIQMESLLKKGGE